MAGGLAEYGVFESDRCIAIPDGVSMTNAAAIRLVMEPLTLLLTTGQISKQVKTPFWAPGGASDWPRWSGKKWVHALLQSQGKRKTVPRRLAGRDHVIDADIEDLRDQIKSFGGADVVYDPVGGNQFSDAFRATNPDGRILIIGFASGNLRDQSPSYDGEKHFCN